LICESIDTTVAIAPRLDFLVRFEGRADGEKVVVVVELHPDYVATDEPAAVWVFAKHGELTEAGVLLAEYRQPHRPAVHGGVVGQREVGAEPAE